jgi:hypothetical protein
MVHGTTVFNVRLMHAAYQKYYTWCNNILSQIPYQTRSGAKAPEEVSRGQMLLLQMTLVNASLSLFHCKSIINVGVHTKRKHDLEFDLSRSLKVKRNNKR